jgi:hypothetical protein
MFELDRTFCQRNPKNGLMEWFFSAREGIFGPYQSKKIAIDEMKIFIDRREATKDDGGRSPTKNKETLSLAPIDHLELEPVVFDHSKRKKGIDE